MTRYYAAGNPASFWNKACKKWIAPFVWITLWGICLLTACGELDDHYSTNPNLRLTFSTDTLSFDTVFTTVGTATRQFMIYNENKEALNMESVLLASGGESGFRINVDGRKGVAFQDVGIMERDSMFVFVEVTVNPTDRNQPMLIEDSIVFRVNGISQTVLLEAYGQDVHLYKGGVRFERDTVLPADRPYLLYDSLVVAPDVTVGIEAGASFYLHDKARWVIYGTLQADGTRDEPVTIRGDRLDNLLTDLPYDRTPGLWGGLFFQSSSFDNRLSHVIVRNGTTGITLAASTPERQKMSIRHSQITHMKGNALTAVNCRMDVSDTEISNASGAALLLAGGSYELTHCTVANYMRLALVDSLQKVGVALLNTLSEQEDYPVNARFRNCIIDGGGSNELLLNLTDRVSAEYQFDHCMIKLRNTPEVSDSHYTDCQIRSWSPTYRSVGTSDTDYVYDFRLASDTTLCVGAADVEVSRQYPVDRLGVDRLQSEKGPSIGAYEYVTLEDEEEE
ncbi:MAG: hypothetical protein ACI30I_09690 [Parabacteroides sp.]